MENQVIGIEMNESLTYILGLTGYREMIYNIIYDASKDGYIIKKPTVKYIREYIKCSKAKIKKHIQYLIDKKLIEELGNIKDEDIIRKTYKIKELPKEIIQKAKILNEYWKNYYLQK